MKVLITGARGLLGTHMHALLKAKNCAAIFSGKEQPFDIKIVNREDFSDPTVLALSLIHI